MTTHPDAYDQRYTDYQTNRSRLRRWVRGFYLRSAARLAQGPAIDFGCGIGELLQELPAGSTGLEINQATVDFCRRRGLDVQLYDADSDGWSLSPLQQSGARYRSIVLSHVLEHLDDPVRYLNALLKAAHRLGVQRALAIVPGKSGYRSDDTHLTFVDMAMLSDPAVVAGTPFTVESEQYFPGNLRAIGDVFTHHELRVVFAVPSGD